MNMRVLMLVGLVVFAGCIVPADLTTGDGGGGGGGGGADGGTGGGGGGVSTCTGISSTGVAPQLAGSISISLSGCDPRPVVVTGPDGSPIDAGLTVDSQSTGISIPGAAPGRYSVTVGSGSDAQEIAIEVYDELSLDAGVLRTYVDRIDSCLFVALTKEERLVCQREHEVWIYEPDGGQHTHFAGDEVSVANNEIWSRLGTGIELHLDSATGVRLAAADPNANLVSSFNETAPGRSIRAGTEQLVEFTWDGTTLGSRSWWISVPYLFFLRDADSLWSLSSLHPLCTTRQGCSDHLCSPVSMCPFSELLVPVAVAPDRIWVRRPQTDSGATVAELMRPIDPARPLTFRQIPYLAAPGSGRSDCERPVFSEVTPATVLVVASEHGPSFFRRTSERAIANTSSWIITSVDPFIVRFTPLQ